MATTTEPTAWALTSITQTTNTSTSLLDLPSELRIQIYDHLFALCNPDWPTLAPKTLQLARADTFPGLMRTCRLLRSEAMPHYCAHLLAMRNLLDHRIKFDKYICKDLELHLETIVFSLRSGRVQQIKAAIGTARAGVKAAKKLMEHIDAVLEALRKVKA